MASAMTEAIGGDADVAHQPAHPPAHPPAPPSARTAAAARPGRLSGAIASPFAVTARVAGAHIDPAPGLDRIGDGGVAVLRALAERSDPPTAAPAEPAEPPAPETIISPRLAARLATAIVRPLSPASPRAAVPGLDDGATSAVDALARHPGFSGPLNRAVARLSGMSDIVFDQHSLQAVGRGNASDCALFLATAAASLLEQAALHLGAILLHRQLLGLALRRDRQTLQRLLGDETFRIATREAPMLYADLEHLDDRSFVVARAGLDDEAQVVHGITSVGQRALHGFVARIEPPLVPLLTMRHRRPGEDAAATAAQMTDRQLNHIARLLHRRYGPWQPITG